jgi:hypothetical protein
MTTLSLFTRQLRKVWSMKTIQFWWAKLTYLPLVAVGYYLIARSLTVSYRLLVPYALVGAYFYLFANFGKFGALRHWGMLLYFSGLWLLYVLVFLGWYAWCGERRYWTAWKMAQNLHRTPKQSPDTAR